MNEFTCNFEDDFFTDPSTSVLYDDYVLSISNPLNGSVAGSVNSLSEIFVEWYLFDSSKPKTIEDFLETESLQGIFTPEQFIAIMAGTAHIDKNLCTILSHLLPFKITTQRIFALNRFIENSTPEITCSTDALFIKHKLILEKKKEYARQYHLEHQEEIRTRRHAHYLKNKEKIQEQIKKYYLTHRDEILEKQKQWRMQNAEHLKQYHANYRKNNPEIVSERKKRSYQKKKEQYIAKSHTYYSENKTDILKKQREYYQRNKVHALQQQREYYEKHKAEINQRKALKDKEYTEDRQLAKQICPTFRFLMELKANNRDLFLTKFTKREAIATKAKKKCAALQTGDWSQCSLCTGARSTCPITRAFEFENALVNIRKHANQIISENQK